MTQTKQINLTLSLIVVLLLTFSCKGKESNPITVSKKDESLTETKTEQSAKCAVKELTKDEFDTILNSGIIDSIDYKGELVTCYEVSDKSGNHFLILTHDYDKNTIHSYYADKNAFDSKLVWDLNDSIIKNDYSEEYDINFLKKYISVEDLDQDELVDIIITYKTKSKEDYDRLKIVTWSGNTKTLINHEGASLDDERETKIDQGFYKLPKSIKQKIYGFMKEIDSEVLSINSNVLNKIESSIY